jgi:hypothetical protein
LVAVDVRDLECFAFFDLKSVGWGVNGEVA